MKERKGKEMILKVLKINELKVAVME